MSLFLAQGNLAMYQKLTFVALGGAVVLLALIAWQTAPAQPKPSPLEMVAQAQPVPRPAAPAVKQSADPAPANGNDVRKPGAQLPITQVVLFSSGVGYFQREGQVEGAARVDLSFPVQDINDLLKSMVLQDLGGGR